MDLRYLFSLDVIDGINRKHLPSPTDKLRWRTPEFYFYYVALLFLVPSMFKAALNISNKSHPNYKHYSSLLEKGWIPGRLVDNSDDQYASFRNQIPTLFLVFAAHVGLRTLFERVTRFGSRFASRITFDCVSGLLFIFGLHGSSGIKLIALVSVVYIIGAITRNNIFNPVLTWTTVIGLLFLNEHYDGYRFAHIIPALAWLDAFKGVQERWHIHFNITVLRLISYNMDYYWSFKDLPPKTRLEGREMTERERIEIPALPTDFNYTNFISYVFYPPLYLAGPILTFNNYVAQQYKVPSSISPKRTLAYAIRLLVAILTMELVLHYLYVVAISKAHAWEGDTPAQISMIGYFNLHIIWLKLLIPWRFFRLWALADGVETTENMIRCMSNNYSATAFWRAWHRSFNRWIVRYIYIPLGGTKGKLRAILNMLAVFTFVALWHDISLKLLTWGWLITLFALPEMAGHAAFPASKWASSPYYRLLSGVGAIPPMLMMLVANLVGFCVGVDGLRDMVAAIFGAYSGWAFLVLACFGIFVGTQIMFEIREDEALRGINLRC